VAAEDSADRDLRGRVSQQSLVSQMDRPTERHDLPHRVSEVMPGTSPGLACDGSVICRGEKPVMLPEKADDASLLVERDELPLEASLQRDRVVVPSRGSCIRRVSRLRCRSGLCHDDERAQASESCSQVSYLRFGDRAAARAREPLVSLVRGTLHEAERAAGTT
jgi:hypothetical protein